MRGATLGQEESRPPAGPRHHAVTITERARPVCLGSGSCLCLARFLIPDGVAEFFLGFYFPIIKGGVCVNACELSCSHPFHRLVLIIIDRDLLFQ